MKKILIVALLIQTFTSFSQHLKLYELGTLVSKDNNFGSARFDAMSGAFGALGVDPSSVNINPAGSVIGVESPFSVSLGVNSKGVKASYYGNTTDNDDENLHFTQLGAILNFENNNSEKWNRIALTINYQLKNDFNSVFNTEGNSGFAFFDEHPKDKSNPKIKYDKAINQSFSNRIKGNSSVLNLGIASVYDKKLHLGASLNLHYFELEQTTKLNERNENNTGDILRVFNEQYQKFDSSGFSIALGFIYKIEQNLRVGLAYESPTWYEEVFEKNNINVFDPNDSSYDKWLGYTNIPETNEINEEINSGETINEYIFRLRTPSKVTTSAAYIFNKKGLISVDYTYKNYSGIRFNNLDLNTSNQIKNTYREYYKSSHAINVGTEWRFDKLNIRGGYHFEKNPDKNAISSDNQKGFSAGLGYNFGNIKIDLAYRNDNYTGFYNIYDVKNVNSIKLDNSNSRISTTLRFNL